MAFADWEIVKGNADASFEKYLDTKAIRQSGPMNTMRRVWEVSNLAKAAPNKALSIKSHVEYDCKDRRVRILAELNFSEHFAQGNDLTIKAQEREPGKWGEIEKGGATEFIFNRVCPRG